MRFAKQIHTDRLALHPLQKRYFWFFCMLLGNQRVRRHLGGPVDWRKRLPQFRHYLAPPDYVGVWVVSLVDRRQPIGLVELGPHKDGNDYEISYQFAPAFWGKGFAGEAIRAVISRALGDSGLGRIIAETQSANSASCRLLREQGMVELERVHRFGKEQIIFATN